MSIKQAIEALPPLPEFTGWIGANDQDPDAGEMGYTAEQMREYALAALRSMPAEPVDDALNTLCKMMHSGEEVEGDDGLAMLVPIDLWNEAQEAIELLVGEDDATPHTEAVRMSEAEIEDCIDKAKTAFENRRRGVGGQLVTTYDDWGHWFARAVEQATAARLGVKMGDV